MTTPISDDRLREIAAGEYGPNRQEGKAMAAELLAVRAGLARLHQDCKRWLTESDDRPNLRAAEKRVRLLASDPLRVAEAHARRNATPDDLAARGALAAAMAGAAQDAVDAGMLHPDWMPPRKPDGSR